MTFHVFITTPRAGLGFAVSPYTVECKEVFNNRNQAQNFATAKTMSAGVVALFDAMPSLFRPWAAGSAVALGEFRSYQGRSYRCIQSHTPIVGWEPPNVPALWTTVPNPGASAWQAGVAYALPSRATHGTLLYQLVQSHTAQTGWEPPNVPALWSEIGLASSVSPYTRALWEVVDSTSPEYTERTRVLEPS
jgi:hypothetical protein